MAHRSRFIGAGAIALAMGVLIALPTFSTGATVKNDLRSFDAVSPRAAHTSATPRTEPPLHGTNPHGQGTAAVVDLSPNDTRPFTVDETGSADHEDIVLGRSRGEQRADGTYHGHVTVAALFGNEIIEGADTGPGQTVNEALGPLSVAGITLTGVEVHSATTTAGSSNSFSLLSAALGGTVTGVPAAVPALRIGAAESSGNITRAGNCQTSNGASHVVDIAAATAVAQVAESASNSRACTGAASTQSNTSRVVQLGATGLPIPSAGCANGTADAVTDVLGVLTLVCNADDSSAVAAPGGAQADVAGTPYGVRNALDVYVLAVLGTPLAQVSTAQSESLAVAPAAAPTTTTTTPTTTTTTPTTTTPATQTTPVTTTTPATADDGTTDDGGAGDTTGDDGAGDDGAGDDGAGNAGAGGGGGAPECIDGVDNDGDGKIDFGNDPGCSSRSDDSEADNVSLGGNELPFTGTDVVVLGLAGSILLAAGLTLRVPARRREFE